MSGADNRHHIFPRPARGLARRLFAACVAAAGVTFGVACGASDPSPCPALSRALDQLGSASGRPLIGRVDDALAAARAECAEPMRAARGPGSARQLARARLLDDQPALALAELGTTFEPALALRRAELLERAGRIEDARADLARALALAPDLDAVAHLRLLDVAVAAQRNDVAAVTRLINAAPLPDRPRLAHRAAADFVPARLGELSALPELAMSAGDRLEELQGPAAALAIRERAAELAPDLAEVWDALGRSRIASGRIDDALAAWDRAIAIAPAQATYRTTPIHALVIANALPRARARAFALAADARAAATPELLVIASAGAAIVDAKLALELAREAQQRRPTDGRLAFLVAQRLAEANQFAAAARAYADLLVCGAHGRAWHRHEVAAKLQELGTAARAALDEKRLCEPVDAADLAQYTNALRAIR